MSVKRAKSTCFSIIALTMCLFMALSLNTLMQSVSFPNTTEDLDTNWSFSLDGEMFTAIPHISRAAFSTPHDGSGITLTHPMPVTNAPYPVLVFDIVNAAIEAYNDETLIFTHGKNEYNKDTFIGNGTAIIPLDSFNAHDTVTLKLYPLRRGGVLRIRVPKLIGATDYSTYLIHNNLFSFACTIFLFVIGVSGTLVSIGVLFVKKPSYLLLALSQCALWTSVGLTCANGFVQLFSWDFAFNTNLMYLAFSLMLLCLITVLFLQQTDSKHELLNRAFFSVFAVIALASTVVAPLVRGEYSLTINRFYEATVILSIAYIVFRAARCIFTKKIERSIMAFGIVALFLFWLLDVINYSVTIYALGTFAKLRCTYFTFGMVVLFACAVIHYIVAVSASSHTAAHGAIQKESAYLDHTTGAFNRAKSITTLKDLDESKSEYGIITFTLTECEPNEENAYNSNDEKTERITAFAAIIKRVFDCYGVVGRLDGTKFIVVTVGVMKQKLVQLMYVFNELVSRANTQDGRAWSVKTGYAGKSESSAEDYRALYAIAEATTFSKDEN